MSEESYPELEQFREQWRAEVIARSQGATSSRKGPEPVPRFREEFLESRLHPAVRPPFTTQSIPEVETEDYGPEEPEGKASSDSDADIAGPSGPSSNSRSSQEPQSALEHYEKAVEREDQGNLGDSLSHYRKAYRVRPHLLPTTSTYMYS